ncbi:hypothetical protein AB3K78_14730 [Leucobacter sp. HNU]|uniref:hypothetical protein n=1 Tax=Leucobacter sp. HNU TaxID=3236805 RepID=UPI003A8090B9
MSSTTRNQIQAGIVSARPRKWTLALPRFEKTNSSAIASSTIAMTVLAERPFGSDAGPGAFAGAPVVCGI